MPFPTGKLATSQKVGRALESLSWETVLDREDSPFPEFTRVWSCLGVQSVACQNPLQCDGLSFYASLHWGKRWGATRGEGISLCVRKMTRGYTTPAPVPPLFIQSWD